jgi:hypothetical protein
MTKDLVIIEKTELANASGAQLSAVAEPTLKLIGDFYSKMGNGFQTDVEITTGEIKWDSEEKILSAKPNTLKMSFYPLTKHKEGVNNEY